MNHHLSATLSALVLFTTFPTGAWAGPQEVVVEHAWARASFRTNRPGAAYLDVTNAGAEPVTLVGLETDLAMMSEIHRTSVNAEGVSSMAPAGEIMIAPGETVSLEPGGLHAMLMHLQAPMTEGESLTLTLVFANNDAVTVDVPILGIAARGPEDR